VRNQRLAIEHDPTSVELLVQSRSQSRQAAGPIRGADPDHAWSPSTEPADPIGRELKRPFGRSGRLERFGDCRYAVRAL
jgi:hypothetical protein